MTAAPDIRVEVAFALPKRQALLPLVVRDATTVAEAIRASGIEALFPDTDFNSLPCGIWGQRVAANRPLADGDRVEIYRPLQINPREARRRLAAHGRVMGQHDSQAAGD